MRFLPLLSALLSLADLDPGEAVSRQAKGFGYTFLAVAFLLMACVLAVGALAFYLAQHMDTWVALGAIALGFLGAAGLVSWFATLTARAEAERAGQVAAARRKATLGALAGLAAGGGSSRILILAALAGLVAGGLLGSGAASEKND